MRMTSSRSGASGTRSLSLAFAVPRRSNAFCRAMKSGFPGESSTMASSSIQALSAGTPYNAARMRWAEQVSDRVRVKPRPSGARRRHFRDFERPAERLQNCCFHVISVCEHGTKRFWQAYNGQQGVAPSLDSRVPPSNGRQTYWSRRSEVNSATSCAHDAKG